MIRKYNTDIIGTQKRLKEQIDYLPDHHPEDQKPGIMLEPTVLHKNWDFRDLGDMYFDSNSDPLEIENKIKDHNCELEIIKRRSY